MENIYESLSELIETLPADEFTDRVISELSQKPEYLPYLFEVLNFVKRRELGVPMHQTDRDDTVVPEEQREEVREVFRENCRRVAQCFVDFGEIAASWPYFRAGGDIEPFKKALDEWDLDVEQLDMENEARFNAIYEVAFTQGAHPVRGYELLLKFHGTCDGITTFERQFPHSKEVRQECAKLLIRRLYSEIIEGMERDITRRDGSAPGANTVRELLEGRDWLFEDGTMHVDDSHVQSVIRIAGTLSVCEELELVVEMCDYGNRLEGSDAGPPTPPFLDFYSDYKLYIEALLGRNIEQAVEHFKQRAEDAGDEDNAFASQLLTFLLAQVGRTEEAIDVFVQKLSRLPKPPALAPSIIGMCERVGDSSRLKENAKERQDILQLIAGRLLEL